MMDLWIQVEVLERFVLHRQDEAERLALGEFHPTWAG